MLGYAVAVEDHVDGHALAAQAGPDRPGQHLVILHDEHSHASNDARRTVSMRCQQATPGRHRRWRRTVGMEATIEVCELRKRFGPVLALDGMTFTVQPGQVTGFVGPNGAGKSTTMRVILGLDAPDEGTALVGGRRYASLAHPLGQVGSLLDAAALQPSRAGRDHPLGLAPEAGVSARRVDQVTELTGLKSAAKRRAGG